MLPQTYNAQWIKGPKNMANASHQHDGISEEEHAKALETWNGQQSQIKETEADVGKWHPPMSLIRQKLDAIRKGLDDLEAAL